MQKRLAILLLLAVMGTVYGDDQLTATIIGSGSPAYSAERAGASVLITQGKTTILVDMGNGTRANLEELKIETRNIAALLITHHHLDHIEEFPPLLIRNLLGRHSFLIVGPPGTKKMTDTVVELYSEDITYRLGKTARRLADRTIAYTAKDIKDQETFEIKGIKVSTLKVPHTAHTLAYRFDHQGSSIVITGDLTYTEALPLFAKDADYMIIDSGGMIMKDGKNAARHKKGRKKRSARKDSKFRAHLDLYDSSSIAQAAGVTNLVYTHFTPGEVDEDASLAVIREQYVGNVIFSKDRLTLTRKIAAAAAELEKPIQTMRNLTYPIVDTGVTTFYNDSMKIGTPSKGKAYYGQDAQLQKNTPDYNDNKDGTITDAVTGLMWQKSMGEKMTYVDAQMKVIRCRTGGHDDWRIPTIKELYSLIQFTGQVKKQRSERLFIDANYFDQPLGNAWSGEREIDAQTWSSTEYVGRTMRNDETIFGVNFVDGRIKGYPKFHPRTKQPHTMYFRFVRGNQEYGTNNYIDNNNGTITDLATGLMWQSSDSRSGLDWRDGLKYADDLTLGGFSDWRVPNAKELHSIVDYSRAPQINKSAAINPIFSVTPIKDPEGNKNYPYYWTSTTHQDGPRPASMAVYIAFGEAQGNMHNKLMDVHGAGSQRSDPKSGIKSEYPRFFGPQGDVRYVYNFVRCVRTAK